PALNHKPLTKGEGFVSGLGGPAGPPFFYDGKVAASGAVSMRRRMPALQKNNTRKKIGFC
ncbi:MAG: hypothetical protein WD767_02635, partial [Alphaproteobacteria bacterium]